MAELCDHPFEYQHFETDLTEDETGVVYPYTKSVWCDKCQQDITDELNWKEEPDEQTEF